MSSKVGSDIGVKPSDGTVQRVRTPSTVELMLLTTVLLWALNLTVTQGMPAFNANAEGRRLAGRAKEIYAEAGAQLSLLERTGGGTDAAWAARSGKPVVEALGLPGAGYHSANEEYVVLDKIAPRLYLAARLVMEIAGAQR